jgi:hypothetical protein
MTVVSDGRDGCTAVGIEKREKVLGKSEREGREMGMLIEKLGIACAKQGQSRAARTEQGNRPRKGERMREV